MMMMNQHITMSTNSSSFSAGTQARTAFTFRSHLPFSPASANTYSPPHPPFIQTTHTHTVPVHGSDVRVNDEGMTEVAEGVTEDNVMEDMAKANGIDPENFDYDKWLEEQKLEIEGEDKA